MPETYAPLNPPRRLLMGPGPSPVEPRVYQAMTKPIVGHLDPYFFEVTEDVRSLLQEVFGTANEFTLAISGTGTSGMETAVANFVESGSKVCVFANGYFCDRISEMVRRQGAQVVRLEKPWGETFSDDEARRFILEEKPQVVAFVHAETSTGAVQPGKAICDAAHEAGALVIADTVTSLGNIPVNVDETGIDIAYSCSQKGLACPPGLAPVTVSPRAVEWLRRRGTMNRSFYLDLKLLDEYLLSAHKYHHTAPISMFYALREALIIVHEEGLENRFRRIERNHRAFVAGIEAMGLRMHVEEGRRLYPLNTPRVPEGVDDGKVRARMLAEDGIEILGGFGPLAGKVWRIGIMGAGSTKENVLLLLESFQRSLEAEGYRPAANGRAAAEAFYAQA
ncbi:MAG TPA: alanine--glyoxylate aminotransferase family protein [Bryobacterales bacterium]|nr:alanine--glyoxylate aminotransferase family protein [Bryobacterales bacterium]